MRCSPNCKNIAKTEFVNSLVAFFRRQIEMQTKGLGGKFAELFTITWSKAGELRPIKYLSDHLAHIIMQEEKKMKKFIPTKPPTSLPKRRKTHIVGQLTSEVKELDRVYFSDVSKFQEDTAKLIEELHERGEGSMYSLMQPFVRPTIAELVKEKERIDVLCSMQVEVGGKKKEVLR